VPLREVNIGEIVRIRPGEQIGTDGEVVSGRSTVDEALLTGESLSVEKAPGSPYLCVRMCRLSPVSGFE
jgi:P-type E1-E2 ATPase